MPSLYSHDQALPESMLLESQGYGRETPWGVRERGIPPKSGAGSVGMEPL